MLKLCKDTAIYFVDGTMSNRGTIFISHARPADDELTRWLCGRLTARGYRVWADLDQLLGGDRFWSDIQRVIRQDTAKFITIMTHISVTRDGVLNELAEAADVSKGLSDPKFIIPIRADDIPWSEFPIQLKQINGLDFSEDWMRNFGTLLKTLEAGGVPRAAGDPEVARNAELLVQARQRIQRRPSEALLNRLNIVELPERIHYFHTSMSATDLAIAAPGLALPCAAHDRLLVSFADLAAIQAAVPEGMTLELEHRHSLDLGLFLDGSARRGPAVTRQQAHNYLSAILRGAVERQLRNAGLIQFDRRWFVPRDWRADNQARYWRADGKESYRVLVGKSKDLTWHFALSFKVFASAPRRIQLIPHVLFSIDGITPLADQKQLRRRRCKLWWNDKWRDLLLAFCSELFGHREQVTAITLGGGSRMKVETTPMRLTLPVSYSTESAYLPDSEDEAAEWDDDDVSQTAEGAS
jgi:hypothetical protein